MQPSTSYINVYPLCVILVDFYIVQIQLIHFFIFIMKYICKAIGFVGMFHFPIGRRVMESTGIYVFCENKLRTCTIRIFVCFFVCLFALLGNYFILFHNKDPFPLLLNGQQVSIIMKGSHVLYLAHSARKI